MDAAASRRDRDPGADPNRARTTAAAVRSGPGHRRGRGRGRSRRPRRDPGLALAAAAGHRAAGQPRAAHRRLLHGPRRQPADPGLHLALADLYLDRGWRAVAADKLVLLARLADLTDDADTRDAHVRDRAERLPDEPRLAALCA